MKFLAFAVKVDPDKKKVTSTENSETREIEAENYETAFIEASNHVPLHIGEQIAIARIG